MAGTREGCSFQRGLSALFVFPSLSLSAFFFFMRTVEDWNLPTQENCSDALRRMWITFWKRCWKFCRENSGGKDKLQNNSDNKHSNWGRNFYLYNLERCKKPWNVPKDRRHISVCNSTELWFSSRSRRYFSILLMLLRCEKGKQSVVTQCSDENIDMKNEDLFYPQRSIYHQPFISSSMEYGGDNSQLCVGFAPLSVNCRLDNGTIYM